MNYYELNMKLIKKSNINFYDMLKEEDVIPVNIEKVEEGNNYILQTNQVRCFANSIYNLDREMEQLLKEINHTSQTLIIFGLGNGEVFRYIKQYGCNIEHIILIEPSNQLFNEFLKKFNLKKIIEKFKKVEFIINKNIQTAVAETLSVIRERINTKINFVSTLSTRTVYENYFNELSSSVISALRVTTSNASIGAQNTYETVINTLKNIVKEYSSSKELVHYIKGKPIIMVSAGPSLNKNIELLREAKGKAIIVAVGSAIGMLQDKDIEPDFRAAFSPHSNEVNVFKNYEETDIPLIFSDFLYWEVLDKYKGKKFAIVSKNSYLAQYIFKGIDEEQVVVRTEQTVANTMFEFFSNAGCSAFVFVGQDLAYTNSQRYAEGGWSKSLDVQNPEGLIKSKDMYGNDIFTGDAFLSIKSTFENRIREYGNEIKYYNATEGGLNIEGAQNISLKSYIDTLDSLYDVKEDIENCYRNVESYAERVNAVYQDINRQVMEVYKINEERSAELLKLINKRKSGCNFQALFKEYREINDYENKLDEVELYNKVLKYELDVMYKVIIDSFKYDGKDPVKQAISNENMLVKTCLELRKMCSIIVYLTKDKEEK